MKPKLPMMLLLMLAGWINRHQQDMIEYLTQSVFSAVFEVIPVVHIECLDLIAKHSLGNP